MGCLALFRDQNGRVDTFRAPCVNSHFRTEGRGAFHKLCYARAQTIANLDCQRIELQGEFSRLSQSAYENAAESFHSNKVIAKA